MGRKKKMENSKVCNIRLPQKFIDNMPAEYKYIGDYVRAKLNGNVSESSITSIQQKSINFFNSFFMELFAAGKLDEYIESMPELMEMAEIFGKMVQE